MAAAARLACNLCDFVTYDHTEFAQHVHEHKHSAEMPYACDYCESTFYSPSALTRHMRTHLSEKPFKCEICEAAFSQAGHLATHKQMHMDEKPFKCEICEAAFSQANAYTVHKRTHFRAPRSYNCGLCDAGITHNCLLSQYICNLCGIAFQNLRALRIHEEQTHDALINKNYF